MTAVVSLRRAGCINGDAASDEGARRLGRYFITIGILRSWRTSDQIAMHLDRVMSISMASQACNIAGTYTGGVGVHMCL